MFVKTDARFFYAVWTSLSRTQCRFRPIIICFVRVTAKPQDESHDYGHGKFETMASFFVGLALVAAAWHHRSDALSSIGAAIGIGGAILLGDRWTVLDQKNVFFCSGFVSDVFSIRLLNSGFSVSLRNLREIIRPQNSRRSADVDFWV